MDHTLGQRQWANIERWLQFTGRQLSDEELTQLIEEARHAQAENASTNRLEIVRASRGRGRAGRA